MKKNRPANTLSILCKKEILPEITRFILEETTSFGLRYYPVSKQELERKFERIEIEGVEIKIKYAYIDGEIIKYKAEYDDCAKLAKFKNITLLQAYKIVEHHIQKQK
jgi:uncharacterized protein (DUF111 family)